MKLLTDITNNLLTCEEVDLQELPPDKTFYVEIYIFPKKDDYTRNLYACVDFEVFEGKSLVFNQGTGYYLCVIGDQSRYSDILNAKLSRDSFPYKRMGRNYSCFNALTEFKATALKYVKPLPNLQGKNLKYTFGLEFETSKGLIPEHICYQTGLIPLHDGSISGIEYTSIVLDKPYGLTLLKDQVNLLKNSTKFNKNCALHVHCGGYPVDIKAVYALYLICMGIENDLRQYNCPAVFQTDLYKDSGKNYCNAYGKKATFNDFCYAMSNGSTSSIRDLTRGHPSDTGGDHKWNINIRYFWVNFINILFYNRAKTIEFRFLRPTYNLNKIIGWLYIFNAILLYSEQKWKTIDKEYTKYRRSKIEEEEPSSYWYTYYYKNIPSNITLKNIIQTVYEGTAILPHLLKFLVALKDQATHELSTKDMYGAEEEKTDDIYFTTNIALHDS